MGIDYDQDIVDELTRQVELSSPSADLFQWAKEEILRLRSLLGKAEIGPSFSDIAKDLPRNEPHSSR